VSVNSQEHQGAALTVHTGQGNISGMSAHPFSRYNIPAQFNMLSANNIVTSIPHHSPQRSLRGMVRDGASVTHLAVALRAQEGVCRGGLGVWGVATP